MAPKAKPAPKAARSAIADVVSREYTIHLHKRVRPPRSRRRSEWFAWGRADDSKQLHGVSFKKRAPTAVKELKKFAKLAMVRGSPDMSCGRSAARKTRRMA